MLAARWRSLRQNESASARYGRFLVHVAEHARMDLGGIFSGGQLIEKLFVLAGDSLPAVDGAYAVGSAAAIIFRQLRPALNQLNLCRQVAGIAEEQPVFAHHLGIERVLMRQDAVAEAQRLQ